MILLRLPDRIPYQNLFFRVKEVSSDVLNGIVDGRKVSYIDYKHGIYYLDKDLDDRVKLRCIIMDILDLCHGEMGRALDNSQLIFLTNVVFDLLDGFDMIKDTCQGCKDVKYIE